MWPFKNSAEKEKVDAEVDFIKLQDFCVVELVPEIRRELLNWETSKENSMKNANLQIVPACVGISRCGIILTYDDGREFLLSSYISLGDLFLKKTVKQIIDDLKFKIVNGYTTEREGREYRLGLKNGVSA